MHGEDLLVNDRGNREAVEAVGERLPQLDVVPSFAYQKSKSRRRIEQLEQTHIRRRTRKFC